MKKAMLVFFFIGAFSFFSNLPSFAQDPGERDTVRFLDWGTYVICPPCTGRAVVPMYVVNDEYLTEMDIPLEWAGSLSMDTVIFVGERSDSMFQKGYLLYNELKYVRIVAVCPLGQEPIPPGEGILIYLYFTVQDTGLASVNLTVPHTGYFHFAYVLDSFVPLFFPSEYHIQEQSILPGDVNQDGSASISDVVYLINYLFKSGPPPVHHSSGDVNLDCQISISDVIHFINYLFKGGACLEMGCCYPD